MEVQVFRNAQFLANHDVMTRLLQAMSTQMRLALWRQQGLRVFIMESGTVRDAVTAYKEGN